MRRANEYNANLTHNDTCRYVPVEDEKPENTNATSITTKQIKKIQYFIDNAEKYATGTYKSRDKVKSLIELASRLGEKDQQIFNSALERYNEADKKRQPIKKKCPNCNAGMVLRIGKYGQFYGCSKFPYCKGTRPFNS